MKRASSAVHLAIPDELIAALASHPKAALRLCGVAAVTSAGICHMDSGSKENRNPSTSGGQDGENGLGGRREYLSQAKRQRRMTTQQLYLFSALYLVILIFVAVLTRATARRLAGALAGGAAVGVAALGIIALCEAVGWWHMVITWKPYDLVLMWIDFALCAFVFLITWRIARPFGAGAGRDRGRRGGHRPAAGYVVHEALPAVGRRRAGRCAHPGDLRGLCPVGRRGAQNDAADRRSRAAQVLWPDDRGSPPPRPLKLIWPGMLLSGILRFAEAGHLDERCRYVARHGGVRSVRVSESLVPAPSRDTRSVRGIIQA